MLMAADAIRPAIPVMYASMALAFPIILKIATLHVIWMKYVPMVSVYRSVIRNVIPVNARLAIPVQDNAKAAGRVKSAKTAHVSMKTGASIAENLAAMQIRIADRICTAKMESVFVMRDIPVKMESVLMWIAFVLIRIICLGGVKKPVYMIQAYIGISMKI
jgi:hypothetical protein